MLLHKTAAKSLLNRIAKEQQIKEMKDWYNISYQTFCDSGGRAVLRNHSNSPLKVLMSVYPEYEWLPWKFQKTPLNFWEDKQNQRKFTDWLSKQLNITEMSGWYDVSAQDFKDHGGDSLLRKYSNSPSKLLTSLYPEHEWLQENFAYFPRNYWKDKKHQKEFVEQMAKELNIKEMSDWYKVSSQTLIDAGAKSLLNYYSGSPIQLLTEMYPEYEWLPWKFERVPLKFWVDVQNQRKYLEWLAKELKFKDMSDWYNATYQNFIDYGGVYLLQHHHHSLFHLLSTVFPEYNWSPQKFTVTTRFWSEITNLTYLINWASKQVNVREMKDWYNIRNEQLIDLGLGVVIIMNQSLDNLLLKVYPEFEWDSNLFSHSNDIWNDDRSAKYFVEWLKKQSENEIIFVQKTIKNCGIKGINTLIQYLKTAFPKLNWTPTLPTISKKTQFILKQCIETLFKNSSLLQEYRHPDISNLELDYFFPEYNLAFEYQGSQHYRYVNVFHRLEAKDDLQSRDKHKTEICKDLGITLIEVPYWWDKKLSSLAASVYIQRPDLFQVKPHGTPIPARPPGDVATKNAASVKKTPLMTATEWDYDKMNPTGWFMTEKFDGMRFFWNGKELFSRHGKKITLPYSISKQLPPSVSLDGELWTQYGLYQEAVALTKSTNEEKWNKATFWIFDSPEVANKTLEERIEFLQQLKLPSFAKIVEFVKCEGKEHLMEFNKSILSKGGEGVMLREPGSLYKGGRSTSLRKFKPFYDTEVKVVKNQYPHGFTCEQLNGKEVFVNVTDSSEEAKRIQPGSVITVKHSGSNVHGTLMYPQFYRERLDVKWDELNKGL